MNISFPRFFLPLLGLFLVSCGAFATPEPLAVTVERIEFYSENINPYVKRVVDVYLPPGYAASDARYKVLYAQDGQDMGSIGLKAMLEKLYAENAIEPVVFVAIHASGERLSEYGTAGIPDYQFRGSRADLYTKMLLEELMPRINADYRTQTGPENTAVMGWSLGGLMAFDLGWNHPDVFGKIGVFSGSLWWHTDNTDLKSMLDSRVAHDMVRRDGKKDGLAFWFESGMLDETEDRDGDGVIDAVQDTRELIETLKSVGYTDADIVNVELPQGRHSPATWGSVLPDFLKWAFPLK
jgi:enterochelin esterase-like enzyme